MKRSPMKRGTPLKRGSGNPYPNLALGPKAKTAQFQQEIASTPSRMMLGRRVYLPEDGTQPFIVQQRSSGPLKRRGEIRECAKCHREYFWSSGARTNQEHCSHACAGGKIRRTKQAQTLARGGPKRDSLDKWFSLIVRSVGYCVNCGATDRLQAAHIISRRYLGVRFSFDNAVCLCAACHMRFTYRPLEWEEWVIARMGEPAYRDLRQRALDYRGPLDRRAIAETLYAAAREKDLTIKGLADGHNGWTGLRDPEAGKRTA